MLLRRLPLSTGSSKSKVSGSSTTTTNPADWARPNYETGVNDALKAYQSGQGSQVYQGERTPGALSDQTKQGQGLLSQTANNFSGQTPSSENLSGIVEGGGVNPYFKQALNNTLSDTANTVNNQASAQGLSSGGLSKQLGTTLGRVGSQAVSDQYNKGVQNQIAAANTIDTQRQNYANTAANLAGQNIRGGLLDTALQQAQDAAAQQKFNEEQQAPWKQLGLLGAATNTFAGQYGTGTSQGQGTTTSQNKMSPLGALLQGGGLLGGALGFF